MIRDDLARVLVELECLRLHSMHVLTQVEQGQIGLEDSIKQYEEGMKLIKQCRNILEQCEKRIETINHDTKENN